MGFLKWIVNLQPYAVGSIVTVAGLYLLNRLWKVLKPAATMASDYLIRGVMFHVVPILTQAMAARFTLKAYARFQLNGPSKSLRIPAVTEVVLDIDQIFVPLTMERAGGSEGYDHSTILDAGNRIQIIGDPGSGKSSVAKRMFRDACKAALRSPRRARFPVLIELRTVPFPEEKTTRDAIEWLLQYVIADLKKFETYEISTCFDAYLRG